MFAQVRKLQQRLSQPTGSATTARIQAEISNLEAQVASLDADQKQIQDRIDQRCANDGEGRDTLLEEAGSRRLPNESQRDFLIRTGKITPFSKMGGRSLVRSSSTLQDALLEAEEEEVGDDDSTEHMQVEQPMSHRHLLLPGFEDDDGSESSSKSLIAIERPAKRRRLSGEQATDSRPAEEYISSNGPSAGEEKNTRPGGGPADDSEPDVPTSNYSEDDERYHEDQSDIISDGTSLKKKARRKRSKGAKEDHVEDPRGVDDGNEQLYQARLQSWVRRRSEARRKAYTRTRALRSSEPTSEAENAIDADGRDVPAIDTEYKDEEEWYMPHPVRPDAEFEGEYRIPGDIYPSLFDYQKTGVQWLWELYSQQVGGIIGDEMGLGKTIQVIAFLAALHYSKKITKPIIVVAPATVMKQWVNEFHRWWPPFRVSILHTSGTGMIDVSREVRREDALLSQMWDNPRRKPIAKGQKAAKKIVDRVIQEGHVLVTTYSGLQTYAELLIPVDWEYAVLDEGHKIRNPNTAITIYCKELRTANRIILSGTPMQNNLTELWSLFDFVFPMRLGTLVNFRHQFEFPIRQGGYANASNLQVQTAMKCAETLKDTISPYLLQRFKVDVAADLPKKSEQVLFCKLTKPQREAYENFLASDDMKSIMNRKRQVLYGVDILRKICNHPDLQEHRVLSIKPGYNYGSGVKSGKMQVVKSLLGLWKETGHKTLLFAQHRIMLDILEKFIRSLGGFKYRRMDGNTPIQHRQDMVDEFNRVPDIHVFLLTTKVGGLGINLTGADRVIIYDPDWNPSTDIQARERAWRLGQKREVMIYRLMSAGTIEEKIYHRQIFKQFLTNKILKDAKQRQTFQMKDLHDLFSLGGADQGATETSELFKGTEVRFGNGSVRAPVTENQDAVNPGGASLESNRRDDSSSVRDVAGVASIERFHGDDDDEQRQAVNHDATNSEARVMEGIFARSGVHSALEHDQIINGKQVVVADPRMIEREAKKIAAEAAKELKKAGEIARTVPVGTPTWTGTFGVAGRPEEPSRQRGFGRGVPRGGPASLEILAGLQDRQVRDRSGDASGASTPGVRASQRSTPEPRGKDFMKMIRDYFLTHGGKVHTQMLIDHFNRYCRTTEQTAEFKEMLKEIATLEKGSRGRARWVLRDEYHDHVAQDHLPKEA